MTTSTAPGSAYREQLRVPVRWWVLLLLLLASLWLALVVSTPPVVHWPSAGLAAALGVGLLLGYGAARVEVEDTALRAGRARLGWAFCGQATALDADGTRRLGGVDADPRAYLLLRPYIATAVRVDVDDDADPTPYWLISTRHPKRLAEAVNARRMVAD
ncbi:MAG: DUF3093 family protein [Nocardioidaceae bacterium]